jgi:hypothetical protein
MLNETNNMAMATTKVVIKMNKLEEKLDQQVSVLRNQSEGFKVHYLSGQKAAAQPAGEQSQPPAPAAGESSGQEHRAEWAHCGPLVRAEWRFQGQLQED